jgi:hypothetical protein
VRFSWCVLTLSLALPLGAQLSAAAGVGALAERRSAMSLRTPTLRSSLRYDHRWTQLTVDGVVINASDGPRIDRGLMQAAFAPGPVGPVRFSTNAQVERLAPPALFARTALTFESAVSASIGAGGVWVGAAVERVRDIDTIPSSPLLRLGGWRRFGNAIVTVTSASHAMRMGGRAGSFQVLQGFDTLQTDTGLVLRPTTDTIRIAAVSSRLRRWSDLEVRGSWSFGRAAFDVAAGARRGLDSLRQASWARVGTTLELTPKLSLTAAAGREPSRIVLGLPPARYARLGLRMAPAALTRPALPTPVRPSPAAFDIRGADSGYYVISVRVPRARTVELSGDFDAWTPIALQQVRAGVWEVALRLAPGTYRMNLRVDGDRWTAPPGAATVADEFNGTVGLVVVR